MSYKPLLDRGAAEAARQRRLSSLNHMRWHPGLPEDDDWRRHTQVLEEEDAFLREARSQVARRAATAPTDPVGFVAWFEDLIDSGPGQGDPLFEWLATACDLEDMRWFLAQEVAGEAGFDDLTAMTLPRMPVRPKLELARNFWDEMGRGNARGMHGRMLQDLASYLNVDAWDGQVVWQAEALANTMAGLCANRRYAYHAIGALGVVELTAPLRSAQVAAGLKRLGIPAKLAHYFDLHAVLDVKHSAAWNAEIVAPLVALDSRFATAMAEGALMRLARGAACFQRYREEKGFLF